MNKPYGRGNLPLVLVSMGRHLVYAEGTKTEPQYVKSVRKAIGEVYGINENNIDIICYETDKTKHTIELIKRAEKDVAKRAAKGETIDAVWIFFDKDSFDDFDEAYKILLDKRALDKNGEAKTNARGLPCDENGIAWMPCYSNESFELWVYLHFEFLSTGLSRDEYIGKINRFIKSRDGEDTYEKNSENLYQLLKEWGGETKKAIASAKRLEAGLPIDGKRPNPSTGVYLFAEFFEAYITKRPID